MLADQKQINFYFYKLIHQILYSKELDEYHSLLNKNYRYLGWKRDLRLVEESWWPAQISIINLLISKKVIQ